MNNTIAPKPPAPRRIASGHRFWVPVLAALLVCLVAPPPAAAQFRSDQSNEMIDEFSDENLDFLEEEEEIEGQLSPVADPLEALNRVVFQFNNDLYFVVLKPLARVYRWGLPKEVRGVVKSLFFYIGSPVRLTNCLLQGKWRALGAEFGRFFLNTTVGLLGVWTPSQYFPHLNPDEEDFGQTLAHYRIGNGIYIVWPFLGPSTLRDSVGFLGDWFYTRYIYELPRSTAIGLYAFKAVNDTSFRLGDYETILEAAIDPYQALRDGYIQYRELKIQK